MRPYTIIFVTETLDGKIARYSGYSKLSCKEDFVLQHLLRRSVDGVMVGANTVIIDNPMLTVRHVIGRSPARIVVDSKLKIDESSKVFKYPGRKILITSTRASLTKLNSLREKGVEIIRVGFKNSNALDLKEAMFKLRTMGLRRIMVEGGGFLINTLLSQGLVDEIRATIAPRIFGKGVSMTGSDLLHQIEELDVELRLISVKVLCGGWVHIVYHVLAPKEPIL